MEVLPIAKMAIPLLYIWANSASLDFSCQEHALLVRHQAIKKVLNVFLNNKRKDSTNSVRKDEVAQYTALKLRTDG